MLLVVKMEEETPCRRQSLETGKGQRRVFLRSLRRACRPVTPGLSPFETHYGFLISTIEIINVLF